MFEVVWEALWPVNLPFTILLGFVLLYWLMVIIGLLDFHSDASALDAAHGDVHVDGSADADLHDGAEGVHGVFKALLQFLNIGQVPAMVVISILSLSLWFFSMVGNHYFNNGSEMRALMLIVPNLAISVLLTKAITTPLKKFFKALDREGEEHKPIIGRTCTIVTSEVNDKFGQAQIETSGAPLLINVRTYGDTVLTRGESALIIKEDLENQIFTVAKLTTSTPQQETSIC